MEKVYDASHVMSPRLQWVNSLYPDDTHICIMHAMNYIIIGLGNGLSPAWHQAKYQNQWQVSDWQLNNQEHINGLVQERRNSIANAMELRLSCTNPSISYWKVIKWNSP